MDDTVYNVKEVSEILKVSKNRVYGLIKSGALPAIKIGGLKVRKVALCEFEEKYEGQDLTDPYRIKAINNAEIEHEIL